MKDLTTYDEHTFTTNQLFVNTSLLHMEDKPSVSSPLICYQVLIDYVTLRTKGMNESGTNKDKPHQWCGKVHG